MKSNLKGYIDKIIIGIIFFLIFICTLLVVFDSFKINFGSKKIIDNDLDGYISVQYKGDDCIDDNSLIHPNAFDLPNDGIDQDCNNSDAKIAAQSIGEKLDRDNDGFEEVEDCDDNQKLINPSAKEIFNKEDDDCDGVTDNDFREFILYRSFSIPSFDSETIIKNSKNFIVEGEIVEAYLYVEASVEVPKRSLTKFDSIYIYLDNGNVGGLLRRDLSLIPRQNTDLITILSYDMKSIPLGNLPYNENEIARRENFLKILNDNPNHRIGAFVGSDRGGLLEKLSIGYKGDVNIK